MAEQTEKSTRKEKRDKGAHSWKDVALGCALIRTASAADLRTGDWRSRRPVIDYDTCIQCGRCYIYCPDVAYTKNEEGEPIWNEYYCKGCGICARECPVDAIAMVEEGASEEDEKEALAAEGGE